MTALVSGAAGCPSGLAPPAAPAPSQDPAAFVVEHGGRKSLDILVRGAKCAGCLSKIESAVNAMPGVEAARLNLSTGRLHVEWVGNLPPGQVTHALTRLGYGAAAVDSRAPDRPGGSEEHRLLADMAVAGLATAFVMFLSEPVWFGSDLPLETRALLRWASALIAIPAAAFAGRYFFATAIASVTRRRLTMDVPISLAVILAIALSLYETATGGKHAYYDASVMLLFFLLIGRYLDARLRRKAYAAANALAAMQTATATRLSAGGLAEAVRAADVQPGDVLLLAAGERLAVDAEVISGASEADLRLITGEVEPATTYIGQTLHAGAVNLSAPIHVRALAPASRSLMADIARLLEAGEQRKSSYRRIADKVAEAYVPQVHALAVAGFLGWLLLGATFAKASFIAITVLIITCPCALALAAPLVQIVAAGRLFREGVYLRSGDALERIAAVDHVIFDKTGTLTLGDPVLREEPNRRSILDTAAMLARASRHPFSRAIALAAGSGPIAEEVEEHPGQGVSGRIDGKVARLGSSSFVGVEGGKGGEMWFAVEGAMPEPFYFEDRLRADAAATVSRLRAMGLEVELLSGDAEERVAHAAAAAGIGRWTAGATPLSKANYLEKLEASGRKVLMVGDGLNDAGAIARAHASLAPGGAVDVSRLASDCVFSGDSLSAVVRIIDIAGAARSRMLQNFALAAIYNVLAVPIALAGWATPLVAAIAMSASSAIVTLNALRPGTRRGVEGAGA